MPEPPTSVAVAVSPIDPLTLWPFAIPTDARRTVRCCRPGRSTLTLVASFVRAVGHDDAQVEEAIEWRTRRVPVGGERRTRVVRRDRRATVDAVESTRTRPTACPGPVFDAVAVRVRRYRASTAPPAGDVIEPGRAAALSMVTVTSGVWNVWLRAVGDDAHVPGRCRSERRRVPVGRVRRSSCRPRSRWSPSRRRSTRSNTTDETPVPAIGRVRRKRVGRAVQERRGSREP